MKVYVLMENHRAEGGGVIGVFDRMLSQEEAERVGRARSGFKPEERDQWCSYDCLEIEVEAVPSP